MKPSSLDRDGRWEQRDALLENFRGIKFLWEFPFVVGPQRRKKTRTEQHRLHAAGHQALKAPPNGGKRAFPISSGFVSREGSCLQFGPLWYAFISSYED